MFPCTTLNAFTYNLTKPLSPHGSRGQSRCIFTFLFLGTSLLVFCVIFYVTENNNKIGNFLNIPQERSTILQIKCRGFCGILD